MVKLLIISIFAILLINTLYMDKNLLEDRFWDIIESDIYEPIISSRTVERCAKEAKEVSQEFALFAINYVNSSKSARFDPSVLFNEFIKEYYGG